MENENNLILENQKNALTMMIPPVGTSIIKPYILDVVERLGKYKLIYDYRVSAWLDKLLPQNTMFGGSLINPSPMVKESFRIAPSGTFSGQSFTQPVNVNSEPQLGAFAKGNVVNVIRFEGNTAVVENPNYVVPDVNSPKVRSWASLISDVANQKEFNIPKEYLSKVDDSTPITVNTGINFGANPKPQPVYNMPKYPENPNDITIKPRIIPELDNEVVLEQNANFVLNQDFTYREESYCPPNARCMQPPELTINAGTKVTGRLIRKNTYNYEFIVKKGLTEIPPYNDFLEIKGKGTGSINIPVEYLTKEVEGIISTDTRTPVSVIALVDKNRGKCNTDGALIQNERYDPCRVSAIKGQTYNGYISGGSFYGNDGNAYLPINEYQIVQQNSGTVVPMKNNNKNILMIVGAFLAGYIVFGNSKSSN